ncbi:MAG TPA: hypothetical protein VGJ13_20455 [Pseudonocardiaceae bacterium]|jgi:hypothetical protein
MTQPREPEHQEAPSHRTAGTRTESIPAAPEYAIEPPPLARPVDAPGVVRCSFWLWMGSVAVGLLVTAYSVSKFDQLRGLLEGQVRARRPEIGIELLDRAVDTTLYVGLAGTTTVILVQLLLAVLMRSRRNWARIILALMGALGIAGMTFSLVTVDQQVQIALPLQAALIVIAIVLMFAPGAGTWFRRSTE